MRFASIIIIYSFKLTGIYSVVIMALSGAINLSWLAAPQKDSISAHVCDETVVIVHRPIHVRTSEDA